MEKAVTFTARIVRDGQWFIAFSPEFPEGNGQGLTEEEALQSLRESILLLLEDRREAARPMGLRAGFDHAGFNRLADDLEAEAFLDSTRKLADQSR